jgi:hypothetical protein
MLPPSALETSPESTKSLGTSITTGSWGTVAGPSGRARCGPSTCGSRPFTAANRSRSTGSSAIGVTRIGGGSAYGSHGGTMAAAGCIGCCGARFVTGASRVSSSERRPIAARTGRTPASANRLFTGAQRIANGASSTGSSASEWRRGHRQLRTGVWNGSAEPAPSKPPGCGSSPFTPRPSASPRPGRAPHQDPRSGQSGCSRGRWRRPPSAAGRQRSSAWRSRRPWPSSR